MSASPRNRFNGVLYDGQSAGKTSVALGFNAKGLVLQPPQSKPLLWRYSSFRLKQGQSGKPPFHIEYPVGQSVEHPMATLMVEHPGFLAPWGNLHPKSLPWSMRPGNSTIQKVLLWGGLICIPFLLLFLWRFAIPAIADRVAMKVPETWEDHLGTEFYKAINFKEYETVDLERQKAIDTIVRRLLKAAPGQPYRIRVHMVKWNIVNAFALPGGTLVVFQGLLDKTETPEELAGVLAHEIQHVLLRHSTRNIIHHYSTSMLLSMVVGDSTQMMEAILTLANSMEGLRHTRTMEAEADKEGMTMMVAAGIDPKGMISIFERLSEEHSQIFRDEGDDSEASETEKKALGWLDFFSDHPGWTDRLDSLHAIADKSTVPPKPLLENFDWTRMHNTDR